MQIATSYAKHAAVVSFSRSPPAYADCNNAVLIAEILFLPRGPPAYADCNCKIYKSGLNTRIECVLFEPYRVYLKLNIIQTDLYSLGLRTPSRPKKHKYHCIYLSVTDSHLDCRCFAMILSILRIAMFWLAL